MSEPCTTCDGSGETNCSDYHDCGLDNGDECCGLCDDTGLVECPDCDGSGEE